ncbi:MAG: hypothetical protein K2Q10_05665, partial [Rhodospirillales bacterium]|nr:hypothetical protein [Rhodospirillales bacterium]
RKLVRGEAGSRAGASCPARRLCPLKRSTSNGIRATSIHDSMIFQEKFIHTGVSLGAAPYASHSIKRVSAGCGFGKTHVQAYEPPWRLKWL